MTAPAPIFPIPELPPLRLGVLEVTKLTQFYEINSKVFLMLIVTCYAWFLSGPAAPRPDGQRPGGEKLFEAFCQQIKLILTAASSQIPRNLGGCNGMALALLKHLRHEGILKREHWQDVYGSGREDSKFDRLIGDFVRFVVAKGFEHGQLTTPPILSMLPTRSNLSLRPTQGVTF